MQRLDPGLEVQRKHHVDNTVLCPQGRVRSLKRLGQNPVHPVTACSGQVDEGVTLSCCLTNATALKSRGWKCLMF